MKRLALLIFLIVASAIPAWSQQTAVTATVTDPNGHAYSSGTSSASLVCAGNAQAYSGSYPIPRSVPTVGLDGNGAFSQILYDTSQLVDVNHNPLSCHYTYSVTEQCGVASFTTGALTGITGAGPVDLSTQINSFAVPLSPKCTVGYGGYVYIGPLAGIPAFCAVGQTAFITDATPGRNQYNCTSTNVWTQNTGGGAGNPCVITALSYQFNNSGSFGCALLTQDAAATTVTNSGISNTLGSSIFGGLSPWVDIKDFGANPRPGATQSTTTATTTSGSPTVHLTSAIDFKTKEWVVMNAGIASTQSTPSAPTVATWSVSGSGSASYYCVGRDALGGLSPASTAGTTSTLPAIFGALPTTITAASASGGVVTITVPAMVTTTGEVVQVSGLTGPGAGWNGYFSIATGGTGSFSYNLSGATGTATLGSSPAARPSNTQPITAISRTGNTITITTANAHNYTVGNTTRPSVIIISGVTPVDLNGWYVIATASGSTITATTGQTVTSTETGSVTVGTSFVSGYEYTSVTCPAISGTTTRYYVYSNIAGESEPVGETLPNERVFYDWGPAIGNGFVAPPYVPSTPPSAATNQLWDSQILSGAGTTTLTMSANAPTTQSTPILAQHDDGQAILAAFDSCFSTGFTGGCQVFVSPPNSYNFGKYIINYPLQLTYQGSLIIGNAIIVNETISTNEYNHIDASVGHTYASAAQFGRQPYMTLGGIANPILDIPLQATSIDGIEFNAASNYQSLVTIRFDGYVNITHSAFSMTPFGTSHAIVAYDGAASLHFTDLTFNGGSALGGDLGPLIPAIWLKAGSATGGAVGNFIMDGTNNLSGAGIGIDWSERTTNSSENFKFGDQLWDQQATMPTVYTYGVCNGCGVIEVDRVLNDTSTPPMFASFTNPVGGDPLNVTTVGGSNSLGWPLIGGLPIVGLNVSQPEETTTLGQNTNLNQSDYKGLSTFSLNLLGGGSSAPFTFTGTLIDMGSANATLDLSGNLTVASCTGCGGGISYPGAGIPLSSGSAWLTSVNYLSALTGQVLVATNAAAPTFASKGIAGRTVSGATDTILCDSSTATQDRTATIMYTDASGATVTVPDAGSSGCGSNFVFAVIAGPGSGTVTFNRTTSSTFTVVNGSSATGGATSFTLTVGQFATVSSPDNSNWLVRITP